MIPDESMRVGRMVLYTLSGDDAMQVNRRRTDGASIAERIKASLWPLGAQAHIGNPVRALDRFPMVIVKLNGDSVNGQVLLDGNDVLWAVSVKRGDGPREWQNVE